MAVQTNLQIGMMQRNLEWEHQPRKKDDPIETINAMQLERFAANFACKSLSTVKMLLKSEEL